MAIGRAGEMAGLAGEGAGDDAADFIGAAKDIARGFADFVELEERDHFFVRGHLKNAVGGGVDNGRAGADVLFAQLLDDLRAGGGFVAQRVASDTALEGLHHFGRKAMRE